MTPPDRAVEEAVLRTVLYADLFDFPLTTDEIHRYLIGLRLAPEAVQAALDSSAWLGERLLRANGYIAARSRAEAVTTLRDRRRAASQRILRAALGWLRLVAALPYVRMLAVTGALAMGNSDAGDDVDLLIVAARGRVWLARALCILVVRLARLFGVRLCPNYVLSESALAQSPRNLFVAHELAQMLPIAGGDIYRRMRDANRWSEGYLPNAPTRPINGSDAAPHGLARAAQALIEAALAGRLGDRLERWERERKLVKFAPQAQRPGSAALLDPDHVKGHFDDYGGPLLARYGQRLAEFGITL